MPYIAPEMSDVIVPLVYMQKIVELMESQQNYFLRLVHTFKPSVKLADIHMFLLLFISDGKFATLFVLSL